MRLAALSLLPLCLSAQPIAGFDARALDRSADPCVDFYQFACGGWMKQNPVPPDKARYGRFDELQERNRVVLHGILETVVTAKPGRQPIEQKIGDHFAACMAEEEINKKGAAPIQPDLERIAKLPNKAAITDEIIRQHRDGGSPFFGFGAMPGLKDSSVMIGGLDQGGIGMPDRDYYFKTDARSETLRKEYLAHVEKMLALAALDRPAERAKVVMAIETELAKASLDRVTRRDPTKLDHTLTMQELISLNPGINWERYFQGVAAPPMKSLNVAVPPFFRQIESVLVQNSLDDLKTYLAWHAIHGGARQLSAPFVEEHFRFYGKVLSGRKELEPRWKRCVDATDTALPDALGRKFVEKTLGEEGVKRTRQMVQMLEKALERDIQALEWMSPETKKQALAKLHAITNKIGTKDKWIEYATVEIRRNDYLGNTRRANSFEWDRDSGKIGKPVDKTEWLMRQPEVNAYYSPQTNDINFPAGILQPPFWDNKMDEAVNFGAIGSVIGHELTHGFDDQGRQFDAQGNLRDWWTEKDAKEFNERAACIDKQYSEYPVGDLKLNGKLTLGENVADNGGLRIAHMALLDLLAGKQPPKRDGFSADQRFFLGWAQVWCQNSTPEDARMRVQIDPHSSGRWRTNGVVSNMPEFQKAFACQSGQPMVRVPACRVW